MRHKKQHYAYLVPLKLPIVWTKIFKGKLIVHRKYTLIILNKLNYWGNKITMQNKKTCGNLHLETMYTFTLTVVCYFVLTTFWWTMKGFAYHGWNVSNNVVTFRWLGEGRHIWVAAERSSALESSSGVSDQQSMGSNPCLDILAEHLTTLSFRWDEVGWCRVLCTATKST